MALEGRCACGAVRWKTDQVPTWSGHCHCESCRRASAAPVTSFFGVPRAGLDWTGAVVERQSSKGVTRAFCPACGTQMYYQNAIWPEETHLFATSLLDPSQFKPEAHYHYAERVPWLTITDDLPKHPGMEDMA